MTSARMCSRKTLNSSSGLTVKCQEVINNRLTVHYQLIDRLQQINDRGLHSLHLRGVGFFAVFFITFETMRLHMHNEAPQLLLYTSSNNHSLWGTNIITARCYWPQVHGQLANSVALHCYCVCSELLIPLLWGVCVGGGDKGERSRPQY